MTSFDARLRLIGQTGLPLGVEIDLTGDHMVVRSGDTEVADWSLNEIEVIFRPDGFHIDAEGEEVLINVTNGLRFAEEIGIAPSRP